MESSSLVRSRISACAFSGSFQRSGSSDFAFSSSRRLRAESQSKMPPQQRERLLDFISDILGLGAHKGLRQTRAENRLNGLGCKPARAKRFSRARPFPN